MGLMALLSQTKTTIKSTEEIISKLKSHVYIYLDPRDGKPFYIDKGQGNSFFALVPKWSLGNERKGKDSDL